MKSADTLENLLQGHKSYRMRWGKLLESGTGEGGVKSYNPFWSGFEVITFILLIFWTCEPSALSLVHDVQESEDLRLQEIAEVVTPLT